MPLGIYRTVSQPIINNNLIAVCLPEAIAQLGKQRGYIKGGSCPGNVEPILKKIVAVAGDNIEITSQGVWVNNKLLPHSRALSKDDNLRPLISDNTKYQTLTANQIWLYGTASAKSWDSRYYGPIPRTAIRAAVVPVWIWSKN